MVRENRLNSQPAVGYEKIENRRRRQAVNIVLLGRRFYLLFPPSFVYVVIVVPITRDFFFFMIFFRLYTPGARRLPSLCFGRFRTPAAASALVCDAVDDSVPRVTGNLGCEYPVEQWG